MRLILELKRRKKLFLRFVLVAILIFTFLFFVNQRKDFIVQEATYALEQFFSRESRFDVKIGSVTGKWLGEVRFQEVHVSRAGVLTADALEVFSAKEILFRYNLVNLISKKFDSGVTLVVRDPLIRWRPGVSVSGRPASPLFGWLRDWIISQKRTLSVKIDNLTLDLNSQKTVYDGIHLGYADETFTLEVPIRHATLATADVTTTIRASGKMNLGLFGGEDSLIGEFSTEGSVVNWSPLPNESKFRFKLTESGFSMTSVNFLGGIQTEGYVDFKRDGDIRWQLRAKDYPLSNVDVLFKTLSRKELPEKLDVDVLLSGSFWEPSIEGRARVYGGRMGKQRYKVMDVQISGVCPTVKLFNSRVLMPDDSVMKFSDTTLELRELFRDETYSELVLSAQQETVVWGDWEFRRSQSLSDNDTFSMEHSLGDSMSLHLRESVGTQQNETTVDEELEVGVEYKLSLKDSLKVELRENEEKFIGVERKVSF